MKTSKAGGRARGKDRGTYRSRVRPIRAKPEREAGDIAERSHVLTLGSFPRRTSEDKQGRRPRHRKEMTKNGKMKFILPVFIYPFATLSC